VEWNLRVLEQLAMDPNHTQRVVHQQALRQAVQRAMAEPEQAPASLRREVEALAIAETKGDDAAGRTSEFEPAEAADAPPTASMQGPPPFSLRRISNWFSSAGLRAGGAIAAAAILTAAVLFLPDWGGAGGTGERAGLLSPAKLEMFSKRHVQCVHRIEELRNTAAYPQEVGALPAALERRLDQATPGAATFDLSPIGYAFERAGDCAVPGKGAAHVIYRAKPSTGRSDAMSLWLGRVTEQAPDIKPGRLYRATDDHDAHPLLLWRHGGIMYYLVGNGEQPVQKAARFLQGRMSDAGSARKG
jgi:hypothetical protein